MKKGLIIALIVLVVIVGGIEIGITLNKPKSVSDNSNDVANKNTEQAEVFTFKDGDKQMTPGELFSKETIGLGDEESYSEIASCAFEGLDKTYTYPNYEITTFPDGEQDRIYTIYFLNEEMTTQEGVRVSDSMEKMVQTYGEDYKVQGNQYTYTKGKTNLEFIVENETITSIQYSYVTE